MQISNVQINYSTRYDSISIARKNEPDPPVEQDKATSTINNSPEKQTEEDKETKTTGKSYQGTELSVDDLKKIDSLKKRDQEVRAHEQAHISAGGQYVRSGARFNYQTGPDGMRYAVGGEVTIDTGKEGNPEETVAKMRAVARAALAPANPSGKDRAVAASARKTESEAIQDLNNLNEEEIIKIEKVSESKVENGIDNTEPDHQKSNIANSYSPDSGPELRGSKLDISI